MEQTYNGPVGQVAGGNIINEAPKTPQEKSDQELKQTIAKEKRIIRKARVKQIFNIPNFVLLAVVAGMLAYLWYMIGEGLLSFLNPPQEAQPAWHLFVAAPLILLPAYFSIRATKEQRSIIESSEAEVNKCKIKLNRRRVK